MTEDAGGGGGGVLKGHGKQELAEVLASPHTGQMTPSFCEKPKFRCSVALTIKNNKEVYRHRSWVSRGAAAPQDQKVQKYHFAPIMKISTCLYRYRFISLLIYIDNDIFIITSLA